MQTNFEAGGIIFIIYIYIYRYGGNEIYIITTVPLRLPSKCDVSSGIHELLHKPNCLATGRWGEGILYCRRRILAGSEWVAFQPSGAQNFEVAPRFLEEL
jgi:hypothetical protein